MLESEIETMVFDIWTAVSKDPMPAALLQRATRAEFLCNIVNGTITSAEVAAMIVLQYEEDCKLRKEMD